MLRLRVLVTTAEAEAPVDPHAVTSDIAPVEEAALPEGMNGAS